MRTFRRYRWRPRRRRRRHRHRRRRRRRYMQHRVRASPPLRSWCT